MKEGTRELQLLLIIQDLAAEMGGRNYCHGSHITSLSREQMKKQRLNKVYTLSLYSCLTTQITLDYIA